MTNAEKYKEVFGFEPDKNMCPTTSCQECPGEVQECICTCAWWDSEWRGVVAERATTEEGKWVVDEDITFGNFKKCSNCNKAAEWLDGGSQLLSNFCPNCGASMKKGGAEE